jgi:hypothetical protein
MCDNCFICTVRHGNKHSCAVYGGQPIRSDSGFLPIMWPASNNAAGLAGGSSMVGSALCPWMLQVHRGQKINLTIINFNQQVRTKSLVKIKRN